IVSQAARWRTFSPRAGSQCATSSLRMVATTPGRPCAAGSRSAVRWQRRRSQWYGVGGVGVRCKHGRLFPDFRWRAVRCREFPELTDTPENRRRCAALLRIIKAEIALGTFDYRRHFPNGTRLPTFYPEAAWSGTTVASYLSTWQARRSPFRPDG